MSSLLKGLVGNVRALHIRLLGSVEYEFIATEYKKVSCFGGQLSMTNGMSKVDQDH